MIDLAVAPEVAAPVLADDELDHLVCCLAEPDTPSMTLCGKLDAEGWNGEYINGRYGPNDCIVCVDASRHRLCPTGPNGRCIHYP